MAEIQKILIVDDDSNIAELISLYLTKEMYETKTASDGEEALSLFRSFVPDLIMLDLMLPGIDGYEVCRRIRQESMTPIIMLSAKGETFDKVLGLELGMLLHRSFSCESCCNLHRWKHMHYIFAKRWKTQPNKSDNNGAG